MSDDATGGTGQAGFQGAAPTVVVGAGNSEALKYGRMWARDEYRRVAPGEQLAHLFLQVARPKAGAEVIDFGCGTGRGACALALFGGLRVTAIDFVRNALDPELRDLLDAPRASLRFLKRDLERPLGVAAEYGYCTDVMEHIPPARVDAVLDNVLLAARHAFFSISTVDDSCGALIGEALHLTVRPFAWWMAKFTERRCLVHWSQDAQGAALFYVSAWASGPDVTAIGALNTEDRQIRDNVARNLAGGWAQAAPYPPNDLEVALVGGGPSLDGQRGALRAQVAAGAKLITLNGAYNWALVNGLTPAGTVVVDARAFNARFVRPVVAGRAPGVADEADPAGTPRCRYLLASQCDPAVFAGLPRDQVTMWHTTAELIRDLLVGAYPDGRCYPVMGGSTVLLRAIPLLRMLGYCRFHLYGADSCYADDAHHAYAQPENDASPVLPVSAGGRIFRCAPWMVSQAQEFIDLIRAYGDVIELNVVGDGLLSHILTTNAALSVERDAAALTMEVA